MSRPLFIAISPYGVFVQYCSQCGHGEFIADGSEVRCSRCGSAIARFSEEYTAQLENINLEGMFH